MILDLKRQAAYICPICSEVTSKELNIFDFSGEKPMNLVCECEDCSDQCILIYPKKDKYKFNINCPICGEMHSFIIRKSIFWNKELLLLNCPVSGIHIFFWGSSDSVKTALKEQEEVFEMMRSEAYEDDTVTLLYEIAECIKNIAQTGNLYCTCGGHDITVSIGENGLILHCKNCGASKEILSSEDSLSMLLNASAIVLDSQKH